MRNATTPQVGRTKVRSVACPECGALSGHKCLGHSGKPRASCHADRWVAYRQQASAAISEQSLFTSH
ncbi:zinc finger domain-containing protein [Delftia tsuruhatensis]|uniref:zinc finger domain-containing protein n=1 Tax=Delftia tsuruhatensis TaxID=180282 RepID=UPI003F692890